MIQVNGAARNNGVDFFGEDFRVSVTLNKDQTVSIDSVKREVASKIISFIDNVPILRFIVFFVDTPVLAAAILVMILHDVIRNVEQGSVLLSVNVQLPLTIGFTIISISILVYTIKRSLWRIRQLWKFHGAEHKTLYAQKHDIPLELDEVRNCPRVSACCGTNLVVFFIFFALLLFIAGNYIRIPDYYSVKVIASFILANELFSINDGEAKPILRYFYNVGFWLQQNLFTTEPTDAQLQAAISAIHVLIELETEG